MDWTIDPEDEKLYYITNEKDSTKEGKFKGKFFEYDIRRDHLDAIRSHLSSISYENPYINGFLDLVFPGKPQTKAPIEIHANPVKLIHDDKKDITFITLENERKLSVIKNDKPIILSVHGFPTDVKFDDNFIYVSTYKPNELSVFDYTVLDGSLENEDKLPIKLPINTLSLKYEPRSLVLDKSNNILFFINSDPQLSFVDLRQGIKELKIEDVKYINLMEKRFRPGVVLFDENEKRLIIQNVASRDLIILNATNPNELSNNINGYFEEHKELFPLRSTTAYVDDGADNSLFISTPDTKIIYKLVFGNEGDKTIYQKEIKTGVNRQLVFDDKRKILFVMSYPEYKIDRIDSDNLNSPSVYVDVERDPFSMKFDNVGSILYVTNSKDNSISIVDADEDSPIDHIPIKGYWPADIAFDNKENKLFIVNSHFNEATGSYENDSSIFIINNASKKSLSDKKYNTKFVPLKGLPGSTSIGVNPMNKKIYISNYPNQTVSVLDYSGKILNKIAVGNGPVDIEVNPHRNLVYAANYHDSTLSIINSTNDTVIQNLTVGQGPFYVALVDKSKIIVVNRLSDTVSIIDVVDGSNNTFYHKVTNTVLVRKDPYSFAEPVSADYYNDGDRRLLYVMSSDNRISVIDPDKSNIFPIAEIPIQVSRILDSQDVSTPVFSNDEIELTPSLSGIVINPKNGDIYISSSGYDMLFKYNAKKSKENKINHDQIESIQTAKFPYGIKIDQYTGNVYVPNLRSEYVQVFSSNNTLLSEIKAPDLSYIDIDQDTSDLYISHKHSGNISKYKYISETKEFQNIGNISVGYSPSAIFVDEYVQRLLVTGDNKLEAYDLNNYTLLTANPIPIGLSATSIAVDEYENIIAINDPIENEYTIINGTNYKPLLQDRPDVPVLGTYPSSMVILQMYGSPYISYENSDTIEDFFYNEKIQVGNSPVAMSVNENKERLYVVNEKSSDVYIIDTESNKILNKVKVGYYPNAIDVNLKTDDVYVTSGYTNNIFKFYDDTIVKPLYVFDEHNKSLSYIKSGEISKSGELTILDITNNRNNLTLQFPFVGKDILSDSKNIYVSSVVGDKNLILKINLTDYNITKLETNIYPSIMALGPNNDRLYVLDDSEKKIIVIDTKEFEILKNSEISLDNHIKSIISMGTDYRLNKTEIYLLDRDSNRITIVDAYNKKITKDISLESLNGSPDLIKVNSKTHKVYGTLNGSSSMFVVKNSKAYDISIPSSKLIEDIIFTDVDTMILNSNSTLTLLDYNDSIIKSGFIQYEKICNEATSYHDQPDEIFFFDTKMEKIYIANQVGDDLKVCEAINMSDVQFTEYSTLE